jgi:hypothetical protein
MKINRRKLLSILGISPALLTGSPTLGDATKNKISPTGGGIKLVTLNPKGSPPAIQLIPMAPRLDTLEGKTVYLVSDGFAGADRFLEQMRIWFTKNMPTVSTVYRLKAGGLADDDPKLWAEIKAKGDAMIMAIGH